MKKSITRIICALLAVLMVLTLAACKSNTPAPSTDKTKTSTDTTKAAAGSKSMRFMSNITDRTQTEGLCEQMQLDKWLAKNPEFKLDYEMVPNSGYQDKITTYQASDNLPDIFKTWGGTQLANQVVNKMVVPIFTDINEMRDKYKYLEGVWNKFTVNNVCYAGIANYDAFIWYYNKNMFKEAGLSKPASWDDLKNAIKKFKADGKIPVALAGSQNYAETAMFSVFYDRMTGENKSWVERTEKQDWSTNADAKKAAQYIKDLLDLGMVDASYASIEYGEVRGQFVNEQSPMWWFGTWEFMMLADTTLSQEFKDSIDFFVTPELPGGKGKTTDLYAYAGCGLAVSTKSKYKDNGYDLVRFFYLPENLCKDGWTMSIYITAQDPTQFTTGKEPKLQQDIQNMMKGATSTYVRGAGYNNIFSSEIKQPVNDFFMGQSSVDDLLKAYDTASKKAYADQQQSNKTLGYDYFQAYFKE